MAFTQAANLVEKAVGHGDNASITTDISNYNNEHGMETGDLIQATVWDGKNQVKLGMEIESRFAPALETLMTFSSPNAHA